MFHGIPPDPSGCEEEDSGQTEDKVREVIRIDLQISRYVLGLRYCEISHFICEVYNFELFLQRHSHSSCSKDPVRSTDKRNSTDTRQDMIIDYILHYC